MMKNSSYLYSELKKREIYFKIATFTAFLASSLFIVGFFAGNIKFWTWTEDQWPYGLVGLLLTITVTGFQNILYSQGNVSAGKKMTWFAFALSFAFGMMTEVGGGMEREESRMLDKSVSSPVFQSLMANIGNITGSIGNNPYADRIARAEEMKAAHVLELGRCSRHASKGQKRVNRCEVYEQKKIDAQDSKIAAYKQMASGADSERSNALNNSMTQAKAFERDEKNHHPLVKFIQNFFTIAPIVASFILSALIIGVFEFAFHYTGNSLAELRERFLKEGYDLTSGKMPPVMTRSAEPSAQAIETEMIATPVAQPAKSPMPSFAMPTFATASGDFMTQPVQLAQTEQYKAVGGTQGQQVGRTEVISNTPSEAPAPSKGIGFTSPLTTPVLEPAPAAAEMSTPEAKALLSTIANPKFDEVFVGVATGDTPTAIGSASKKHGTGAEQVRNTLVCLEYCGLVSAKNANGQRTVLDTISADEANEVMSEIKKMIRGAAE